MPARLRKWLRRFRQEGAAGLEDRSSQPQRTPHATPAPQVTFIRQFREQHGRPGWAIARALRMPRSPVGAWRRRLGLNRLPGPPPVPIQCQQPVAKPTRRSAGDPSRLNRAALSLRFGRNTPGIPPSRALSAGRLAGLGAHPGFTTGCQEGRHPGDLLPWTSSFWGAFGVWAIGFMESPAGFTGGGLGYRAGGGGRLYPARLRRGPGRPDGDHRCRLPGPSRRLASGAADQHPSRHERQRQRHRVPAGSGGLSGPCAAPSADASLFKSAATIGASISRSRSALPSTN